MVTHMNTNLIIRRRKQLKLNQSERAEIMGMRVETLNNIEKGRTEPQYSTVKKIAETLNVSYLDLLTSSKEIKEAIKKEVLEEYLENKQETQIDEKEAEIKSLDGIILDNFEERLQDLEERMEQLEKSEETKEAERLKELVKRIYGE